MVVIICLFKYLFHTKFNKIQIHYGNIKVIMSSKYPSSLKSSQLASLLIHKSMNLHILGIQARLNNLKYIFDLRSLMLEKEHSNRKKKCASIRKHPIIAILIFPLERVRYNRRRRKIHRNLVDISKSPSRMATIKLLKTRCEAVFSCTLGKTRVSREKGVTMVAFRLTLSKFKHDGQGLAFCQSKFPFS